MSADLDLDDPAVRQMAERNHTPNEAWSVAGSLLSVHCEMCGHSWPCPTRVRLDEIEIASR